MKKGVVSALVTAGCILLAIFIIGMIQYFSYSNDFQLSSSMYGIFVRNIAIATWLSFLVGGASDLILVWGIKWGIKK